MLHLVFERAVFMTPVFSAELEIAIMAVFRGVFLGFVLVNLSGCPNVPTTDTIGGIPAQCDLGDGVSVEVLTIDTPDQFDLNGAKTIPVKVKLNGPAPSVKTVCFIVRDVQVPVAMPIAMGFALVPRGQERGGTVNGFILNCDSHNEVAGKSFISHELDASTKERSTKFFVQHIENNESFRTLRTLNPATLQFVNVVTGLNGVKSNRPRATCPN